MLGTTRAKGLLVLELGRQAVEVSARPSARPISARGRPAARRSCGIGDAGQLLAHHQRQRFRERRVVLVLDFGEVGLGVFVVQHLVDVAGHAGHGAAAERLDAGLLERIEDGAGLGLCRRALGVDARIVAGAPHRHGVALAAGDGDVAARRPARQFGKRAPCRRQQRPVWPRSRLRARLVRQWRALQRRWRVLNACRCQAVFDLLRVLSPGPAIEARA